jgi:hypothetical protein
MKYFIIYNLPLFIYTPFYLMCFIKCTKSHLPQNKSTQKIVFVWRWSVGRMISNTH